MAMAFFLFVCFYVMAHFKASNLQRHFSSLHANIDQEFSKGNELCKHTLVTLKGQKEKQTRFSKKLQSTGKWIMDLAFLVDMLCHLDRPYLTLQDKSKILPDLVQSVFEFANKLKWFNMHIQKRALTHFPTLLKASKQPCW